MRRALSSAILVVAGCALIVDASRSWALDPSRSITQYAHRQWRLQEGLPQNSVRAIAQTPDGLLWIGTHAGLTRFDGVAFEQVTGPGRGALEHHQVYALAMAADGTLWIGSHGDGLWRLSIDGQLESYSQKIGLHSRQIIALTMDGERLWIGTEDGGLARLDSDGLEVWDEGRGLPSGAIYSLAPDGLGGCWVTTLGAGIHHVSAAGIETYTHEDGLASDLTWSILLARDGTLWIGSSSGLTRFKDGRWQNYGAADGLGGTWVKTLLEDRDGNLWIGLAGGGAVRYREGRFSALASHSRKMEEVVWCLFEDREGQIWYGSLSGGLHQLLDSPLTPFGIEEGLPERQILAVAEAPDGAIWAATLGSGLQRLHGGTFEAWTTAQGLASNGAWGLAFGAEGALWVAHHGPGIDVLHHDGKVEHFDASDGLCKGRLVAVMVASNGDVWAAADGGGISRLRGRNVTTYTTADGLIDDQAQALAESPAGDIWIGSNRGVSIWDGERFTSIKADQGLVNGRIWEILPEANGVAWLGSFGGGLYRVRDGRVDGVVTAVDGLPSNDVTVIVDDLAGHLWLATTAGVAQIERAALDAFLAGEITDLPMLSFDVRHGMRSAEHYGGQPVGIRAHDGQLWFASMDGLVRVDPRKIEHRPPPDVVIQMISIDDRPLPAGQTLSAAEPLMVPNDHDRLEIRYTAATLKEPSRIQFRHRLIGLDDAWRQVGSRRSFEIARLPPASYRFEVEASDDLGRFLDRPKSIAFTVPPRFTQTRAFFALVAVMLVAVGIGLQQLRVRRLRRRQAELQQAAQEAVANVRTLRGLLPICSSCKKIRDDDGYWQRLESYLDKHSEAQLSHGMCPVCFQQFVDDFEAQQKVAETVERS